MRQKIKFSDSMKFKILILVITGIILSTLASLFTALPSARRNVKQVTQNYMLDEVSAYGYILSLELLRDKKYLTKAHGLRSNLQDVRIKDMETSFAYLIAADGTVLYHPQEELVGLATEDPLAQRLLQELAEGSSIQPECVEYEVDGKKKYASYYANTTGDFLLIVTVDSEEIFRTTSRMSVVIIGSSVLALAILLVYGFIMTNRMIGPLNRLAGVVNKVATLDFTETRGMSALCRRKDEVGLISRAISNLYAELRKIIEVIQVQGGKLANSNVEF